MAGRNGDGVNDRVEPLKFLSPDEVRYLAAEFGTPLFVYDEATIELNAAYMMALPHAFGITVRYSLKACPSATIIRLFDRLGLSFDASSIWEASRAVRAGVPPSRILLTAQQAQFDAEVLDLVSAGLNFDAGSLRQLDDFGRARRGRTVSIRINPGFGSGLVRRLTSGGADSSFGIWHADMAEVDRVIKAHDLQLTRLHTHIGSGHDASALVRALEFVLRIAREFPSVQFVNLGGGYRLKSLLDDPQHDHRQWASLVADAMRGFETETGRRLHLEVEPGTFLMAHAGSIVSEVIDVVSTGPGGHTFLKVDAGLTEIVRPSYYGARHPLVSVPAVGDSARLPVELYCIAGHCCIAGDVLTTKSGDVELLEPVALPRTVPGDYLVVERGGAYCSSMAMKNFNSYPECPEVLRRKDGKFDVIRVRQSIDQMMQNERVPADLSGMTSGSGR